MTFVGKHYGETESFLPILFVGGNPWSKDSWVEGMSVSDLARWWELKVYEWLDYRLGPVLEAIAPVARAIWDVVCITDERDGFLLDHVAFTNLYKCPLGDAASKPSRKAADACVSHFISELRLLQPGMVVLFGNFAWSTLQRPSQTEGGVVFVPKGRDEAYAQLAVGQDMWPVLTLAHPSRPQFHPGKYLAAAWFTDAVKWCLQRVNATDWQATGSPRAVPRRLHAQTTPSRSDDK